MPALALVVCPLPADGAAARAVDAMLPALGDNGGTVLFCPEPFRAPPAWARTLRVLPLADLPQERGGGAVTAPVYLLDGGPGEAAFDRYHQQVPGATVQAATDTTADSLRAAAAAAEQEPKVVPVEGGSTVEAMVLAYRSKDYIDPCLQSLLAQDWPDLRITVLDNASGDGTAAHVRRHFPEVEIIESEENLGFAAGHNLLFERSTADFVFLLNHDAAARRNTISELVAAAGTHPKGAVFGCKMLMRRCPTILNSAGIVMKQSGFAVDRGIGRKDRDPGAAPQRVFAACGGAMLIRTEVLEALGGFDPTFFMYVEDVDLCWRARLAGHEVYYVPTATVIHDWHGDLAAKGTDQEEEAEEVVAEREGRRRFMIERNRLQAVFKNYSLGNMLRAWRAVKKNDRGRVKALRRQAGKGGDPLPAQVLDAVRGARSWCRWHVLGMIRRRWQAQGLRKVSDAAFGGLIEEGFGEPTGVGDLHSLVDRHCAEGRAVITLGKADDGCLGPGWHHGEPAGQRWTMAHCWFYLCSEQSWQSVLVEVGPQPRENQVELQVDGVSLGREEVLPGVVQVLRWRLPGKVAQGTVAECMMSSTAFVPSAEGAGPDDRELGLHVSRIWVE